MRDLLIRGGMVVDGTDEPPFPADVRVRAGVIAEVGPRLWPDGEPVLDAGGAFVAPGFIDTHTHLDPSLFWDPLCDPMPQHGVTTVVTGNCSLSLAPVRPEHRGDLAAMFAYIEDIPRSALSGAVPWGWTSWREYDEALRRDGFAVNVASLVGHTALRLFVMGDQAWERPASPTERSRMAAVLDGCLLAGGFGLSTSLFDEDAAKRPVPSRLADDAEVGAVLDVLAARAAFFAFIPNVATHAGILRDVERMARLCRPRGIVASWNGLFHDERKPERSAELLTQAAELQADGARVYPQVSPRRMDVRVNWDGGMAFYSMAPWHQVVQASGEDKRRLLADPAWRTSARAAWEAMPRTLLRHQELDHILLVSVTRPEHGRWVGATLADLAAEWGGHPCDVLADWALANDCRPGIVGIGVANADPGGVAQLLRHPATIVSNSDAGAHVQMMCAAGDTTLLLTRHVRDRGDLPLERAVWELTGRQAALFGIPGRGTVTPGAAADLVVFDLAELAWLPDALVEDLPGGGGPSAPPGRGYRYTVIAGVPTQENGTLTAQRPGRVLSPCV